MNPEIRRGLPFTRQTGRWTCFGTDRYSGFRLG